MHPIIYLEIGLQRVFPLSLIETSRMNIKIYSFLSTRLEGLIPLSDSYPTYPKIRFELMGPFTKRGIRLSLEAINNEFTYKCRRGP